MAINVVTTDQQVKALTQGVNQASAQDKAALLAALGIGAGSGQGAFIAYQTGRRIANNVDATLCQFTCPRDGNIGVGFQWWGTTLGNYRLLYTAARLKKNSQYLSQAPGIFLRKDSPEGTGILVGAQVSCLWIPVQAGDIIQGVGVFVSDDAGSAVSSYQAAPNTGFGSDGLSIMYAG